MPLATDAWYNFETHEFQATPPDLNFASPPDKMTQEEWRYVKIIAEATSQWWRYRRGAAQLNQLGGSSMTGMKTAYDTIKVAQNIARMFAQPRRIEVLTEYGKRHYRAALFYAAEQQVK